MELCQAFESWWWSKCSDSSFHCQRWIVNIYFKDIETNSQLSLIDTNSKLNQASCCNTKSYHMTFTIRSQLLNSQVYGLPLKFSVSYILFTSTSGHVQRFSINAFLPLSSRLIMEHLWAFIFSISGFWTVVDAILFLVFAWYNWTPDKLGDLAIDNVLIFLMWPYSGQFSNTRNLTELLWWDYASPRFSFRQGVLLNTTGSILLLVSPCLSLLSI